MLVVPTEQHLEIVRHALGMGRGKKPYRTHFCAARDTEDHRLCRELEADGLMKLGIRQEVGWCGDIFFVTAKGAAAVGLSHNQYERAMR